MTHHSMRSLPPFTSHPARLRKGMSIGAIALLLAVALPASGLLAPAEVGLGTTLDPATLTLEGRHEGGILDAGHVIVTAADGLYAASDLRVHADVIELLGPVTAAPGVSLAFVATERLVIADELRAGDGLAGADARPEDDLAATPGGDGGHVDLVAPTIVVLPGALLASGSGGDGGGATTAATQALGADGGRGGDISLTGLLTQQPILELGDGGAGGDAVSHGAFDDAPTSPDYTATGGDGGASGSLYLDGQLFSDVDEILRLHDLGFLTGGLGGDGGSALADADALPIEMRASVPGTEPQPAAANPLFCAVPGGCGGPGDSRSQDRRYESAPGICNGDPGGGWGGHAKDGKSLCTEADARATGGEGDYGYFEGGDGGKGTARAAPGGNGGNGHRGYYYYYHYVSEGVFVASSSPYICNPTSCNPINGGFGGQGGRGGEAIGRGGSGGGSLLYGGDGGDGEARGGNGGNGGKGGTGGAVALDNPNSRTFSQLLGDLACDVPGWITLLPYFPSGVSWLCALAGDRYDDIVPACGYGGLKGARGAAGSRSAHGGNPGDGTYQNGNDGGETRVNGAIGADGTNGKYPQYTFTIYTGGYGLRTDWCYDARGSNPW